jgi:hypothetical protein
LPLLQHPPPQQLWWLQQHFHKWHSKTIRLASLAVVLIHMPVEMMAVLLNNRASLAVALKHKLLEKKVHHESLESLAADMMHTPLAKMAVQHSDLANLAVEGLWVNQAVAAQPASVEGPQA